MRAFIRGSSEGAVAVGIAGIVVYLASKVGLFHFNHPEDGLAVALGALVLGIIGIALTR